jgi:arylsulfatase A-like enzyme
MVRSSVRIRSAPLLAVLLAASACGEREPPPAPPASILLLVVDCLRADRVGAAVPYPRPVAPHLDALAAVGTSFTHAFAQTSWTRPSVPTILTGLYPSEHGLGGFLQEGDEVTGGTLSPAAVTVAEALRALGYPTALFGQQNQLAPRFGLDQGFDAYDHKAAKAERIHTRLLAWLDSQPQPRHPFFAYLHYLEMHWPYCSPPATRGLFTAGYQGRPLCAEWRRLRDEIRSGKVKLTPEELEGMRGQYDEELVALDREIGLLFDQLRERGLWDDTLIVLTSDHGEEFFEHGGMAHGTTLYDELIHVPLVIKPPKSWGAAGAAKVSALVEHRDLLPTFLEAAGASLPETGDRRSLKPWLRGDRGVEREFVVAELGGSIALRTADYKLIVDQGRDARLFDLARDPGETRDVAAEEPERVARLEGQLRRWRAGLHPIPPGAEKLDDETVEGLRALGYLD